MTLARQGRQFCLYFYYLTIFRFSLRIARLNSELHSNAWFLSVPHVNLWNEYVAIVQLTMQHLHISNLCMQQIID